MTILWQSALKITSFVKVLLILKTLACCTWFRGQADSNCVMGYFKREPRIVLFNLEFVRSRVMHEALQPSIWGSTRPVLTPLEHGFPWGWEWGKPDQGSLDREAWTGKPGDHLILPFSHSSYYNIFSSLNIKIKVLSE